MSPKSRGRPAGRGKPKTRRQEPLRSLRLSDRLVRAARDLLMYTDPLEVEQWASDWLGQAWLTAPLGDNEAERMLCLEVVGRCSTHPSAHGLAAVAALRRVASPSKDAVDEVIGQLNAERLANRLRDPSGGFSR